MQIWTDSCERCSEGRNVSNILQMFISIEVRLCCTKKKNCGGNIFLLVLVCIFVIITIIAEVKKKYVTFFHDRIIFLSQKSSTKKLQCPLLGQTSSCGVYLTDRLYVHSLMQFVKHAYLKTKYFGPWPFYK